MNSIVEKERLYKEYIDEHRLNVQKAWHNMKNNYECMNIIGKCINCTMDQVINVVDTLIKNHDSSKYSEEEFGPYRKQFYPVSEEEKQMNKDAFDKAWEHHYQNNLHHWDWWYKTGNEEGMSYYYVIEMVCDWEAMGYKFGNTSKSWYNENKEKIHLGVTQRKFAEDLMNALCK